MYKLFLVAGLFLMQQEFPQEGSEEGKALQCDNHKQTPADKRCHCARDEQECHGGMPPKPSDVSMDKRCKTYCVMQHCECRGHGCTS